MRYTINQYSALSTLGNTTLVLIDHNGNTFYGDNHWECIDKFLCYYGG